MAFHWPKMKTQRPFLPKFESESENCSVVPTLCDPMDYIVHGVLQARILEWVAFPFSRGSSQPRIEPRSPTLHVDCLPAEPKEREIRCDSRNYFWSGEVSPRRWRWSWEGSSHEVRERSFAGKGRSKWTGPLGAWIIMKVIQKVSTVRVQHTRVGAKGGDA